MANLVPPTSTDKSSNLKVVPSMLTTGVRVAPLCKSIRGERWLLAAVFTSVQFLTFRLPVISIKVPSKALDTSWQFSKVRLVFSVIFPEIKATLSSSVEANKHSDAETVTDTARSSGARVRAEKIVSVKILQLFNSTFAL